MSETLRVAQKSLKGNMLRLATPEQSDKEGKWYFLTPEVEKFAKNLNVGDTVDPKLEVRGKDNYITYLNTGAVGAEGATKKPWSKPSGFKSGAPYEKKQYSSGNYSAKSPAESEKITRLSVLSSVSNIVANLKLENVDEIESVTVKLFTSLLATVKEGLNVDSATENVAV